jgi:hypothetical protein
MVVDTKHTAQSNKEEHVAIMEQIHAILRIIIKLHSMSKIKGVLGILAVSLGEVL